MLGLSGAPVDVSAVACKFTDRKSRSSFYFQSMAELHHEFDALRTGHFAATILPINWFNNILKTEQ